MHAEVSWLVAGRLIFIRMGGHMTLEKVAEITRQVSGMMNEGQAPIHVLADLCEVQSYPTNLIELSKLADRTQLGLVGWIILVSNNLLIRFSTSMFSQVAGAKTRTFNTYEEAIVFMNEREPSFELAADVLTGTIEEKRSD